MCVCVCVPKRIDRVNVCGNTALGLFYGASLFSGQFSLLTLISHRNISNLSWRKTSENSNPQSHSPVIAQTWLKLKNLNKLRFSVRNFIRIYSLSMHTHTYICMHMYICMCVHMCLYVFICIYHYAYIYLYTPTHILIYPHMQCM